MFITLLVVTFTIALITSLAVVRLFRDPVENILGRVVHKSLAGAWHRYLNFAVVVVGVSGGVRIWELEKYITPRAQAALPIELNLDRWVLEVYRTLIGPLQNAAWLLLVFFAVALLAFVIVRGVEVLRPRKASTTSS